MTLIIQQQTDFFKYKIKNGTPKSTGVPYQFFSVIYSYDSSSERSSSVSSSSLFLTGIAASIPSSGGI